MLAALIVVWPLVQLSIIATGDVNRFGQVRGFAGFENFGAVFSDPDFLAAPWRTLVWTVSIVGGTILAVLSGGAHPRPRLLRTGPRTSHHHAALGGVADHDCHRLAVGAYGRERDAQLGAARPGLIDGNIQWLAQASTAFPMQILIGILVSVPFTVTIFLGGLASIPEDLHEAATLEGASRWQQLPKPSRFR